MGWGLQKNVGLLSGIFIGWCAVLEEMGKGKEG